jgi:hypothetical protein
MRNASRAIHAECTRVNNRRKWYHKRRWVGNNYVTYERNRRNSFLRSRNSYLRQYR